MKSDDQILKTFFAERKQEITDNGFSYKVMKQLPKKNNHVTRTWRAAIAAVALILFVIFDGMQGVASTLRDVFVVTVQQSTTNLDPHSIFIACAVLLFLGIRRIWIAEP